jgi:hypothetical protein
MIDSRSAKIIEGTNGNSSIKADTFSNPLPKGACRRDGLLSDCSVLTSLSESAVVDAIRKHVTMTRTNIHTRPRVAVAMKASVEESMAFGSAEAREADKVGELSLCGLSQFLEKSASVKLTSGTLQ